MLKKFIVSIFIAVILAAAGGFYAYVTYRAPLNHAEQIVSYSKQYGGDPKLLASFIAYESRFTDKKYVQGEKNGLIRLTDETAMRYAQKMNWENFKPEMLEEPENAIKMGAFIIGEWKKEGKNHDEIMDNWAIRNNPDRKENDYYFSSHRDMIRDRYKLYEKFRPSLDR